MKRSTERVQYVAAVMAKSLAYDPPEHGLDLALARRINDTTGWTYDRSSGSPVNWIRVEGDRLSDAELLAAWALALELAAS